jgi:hypothetical protein
METESRTPVSKKERRRAQLRDAQRRWYWRGKNREKKQEKTNNQLGTYTLAFKMPRSEKKQAAQLKQMVRFLGLGDYMKVCHGEKVD